MKLEFQPADFAVAWCSPENSHKEMDVVLATEIARVANARLAEMMKDAVAVYSSKYFGPEANHAWGNKQMFGDTHRARLVEIEAIE